MHANQQKILQKKYATVWNYQWEKLNSMKFKNDNNFVQILETVREQDVYIVQTTEPPVNERVMELLITVDAVKEHQQEE